MKKSELFNRWEHAAIVGAVSGIRSTAGLRGVFNESPVVQMLAIGESVVDKLPFVPERTDLLPMLGRVGFGAYASSQLAESGEEKIPLALIGAATAWLSAQAITAFRKKACEHGVFTGLVAGLVEDAIVFTAFKAMNSLPHDDSTQPALLSA